MFSITYRSDNEATFTIPKDLSWFEGHFPGNPILPGFAIVEISKQLLAEKKGLPIDSAIKIRNAKFSRPVPPETAVVATWETKERGYLMVWTDERDAGEIASLSLDFS